MASEAAQRVIEAASEPRSAATHCPYCALQCGMTLRETPAGGVEVLPRDFPTNRGGLCQKGWTAAELLDHPERLTTPAGARPQGRAAAPGHLGRGARPDRRRASGTSRPRTGATRSPSSAAAG